MNKITSIEFPCGNMAESLCYTTTRNKLFTLATRKLYADRIEPFETYGEYSMIPWVRVWKNNERVCEIPLSACIVYYNES